MFTLSISIKMEIAIRTSVNQKELVDREKLPTNTLSYGNRVQRWANFIAGFSVEFVEECLANRNAQKDVVIDPFLGCGTTLIGARNLGFRGVGVEAHRLFYNLASAKLKTFTTEQLHYVINHLKQKTKQIYWSDSAETFISKMFLESEKIRIKYASYQVSTLQSDIQPLGIAVFLKACELACTAQTDGIYKAPDSKKKSISFDDALCNVMSVFLEDIDSDWYKEHWCFQQEPHLFFHSSENIKGLGDNSIDVCITSPPYLNNFDYAEMTRLQLYLLGWVDSWGDISDKVRNGLITNTTTALKDKKTASYQLLQKDELPDVLTSELQEIVNELKKQKKSRAGKKEYDYLVYPYYGQIFSVIKELYRCLNRGGEIHWVVADAALYGVHIKTQEHTKVLMEAAGFRNVEISWMRQRGHRWILSKRDGAKEALGEYHISANKI